MDDELLGEREIRGLAQVKIPLIRWLKMRGRKVTEEEWDELRLNTLKVWLNKKHPTVLKQWEDEFADFIDLDNWLREYRGAIDQEFRAYLEEK